MQGRRGTSQQQQQRGEAGGAARGASAAAAGPSAAAATGARHDSSIAADSRSDGAMERVMTDGSRPAGGGGVAMPQHPQVNAGYSSGSPGGGGQPAEASLDLDVTVLAFAQWVSEMKSRQHNSSHQMQAEMSIIRNAIQSNNTELGDFKRHSAAIQQQMQSEIIEIRESLSSVFMEITNAVRNNASADQDIKLKVQSLNEQAVRNETAFAQLADAADQSQCKLKNAVQEMQHSSERMRDELTSLNRHTEGLEASLAERTDHIAMDTEQLSQDLKVQLERRKEHLKKMVNDVCGIGDSLTSWMGDFTEQKKITAETQNKLQSSLYVLEQGLRREPSQEMGRLTQQQHLVPVVSQHPIATTSLQGMHERARTHGSPPLPQHQAHAMMPVNMAGGVMQYR